MAVCAARMLGFSALLLLIAAFAPGCDTGRQDSPPSSTEPSAQTDTVFSDRIESLEAEVAVAEAAVSAAEAEAAELAAEQAAEARAAIIRAAELERKLEVTESILFGVFQYPQEETVPPAVLWLPPGGYRTNEASVPIAVMSPRGWTVTIDGAVVEPEVGDSGLVRMISTEVNLDEGVNRITIFAVSNSGEERDLSISVTRDSSLVRRYGRILDNRVDPDRGWAWYAGIDFGEMDLEPEYGQGDFDTGDVAIDFHPVAHDAIGIFTDAATGFSIYGQDRLVLIGDEIRDIFYGFHGHPERLDGDPHTWVVDLLLDDDEITQFIGPVPLGD